MLARDCWIRLTVLSSTSFLVVEDNLGTQKLFRKLLETAGGSDIRFATDGEMQMHLAERDLNVAFVNGQVINPVDRGHIAFRTDDLAAFLKILDDHGIPYSDYGTTFAKEWHQVFFHDPEGNVIEVHQQVG